MFAFFLNPTACCWQIFSFFLFYLFIYFFFVICDTFPSGAPASVSFLLPWKTWCCLSVCWRVCQPACLSVVSLLSACLGAAVGRPAHLVFKTFVKTLPADRCVAVYLRLSVPRENKFSASCRFLTADIEEAERCHDFVVAQCLALRMRAQTLPAAGPSGWWWGAW